MQTLGLRSASDTGWVDDGSTGRPPGAIAAVLRPDLLSCTAAFAAGIGLGLSVFSPPTWLTLACAAAALPGAMLLAHRRRFPPAAVLMLFSIVASGCCWAVLRHEHLSERDLAAMVGDASRIMRLRGTVSSEPLVREGGQGSLAVFSYRPPSTYFRLDVNSAVDRRGNQRPAFGQVLVNCDQTLGTLRHGAVVQVTGHVQRFPPAASPGEFDRAAYARVLGQAGIVRVPHRDLIELLDDRSEAPAMRFSTFRDDVRRRASGWLRSNLPDERRAGRDALLAALLLGEREKDLVDLAETFRRVGLAHLLAISGLHLGIFIGLVLLFVRAAGSPGRLQAWLLIAAVLCYLFLIDVRLPVLRAGLMTIMGCLGVAMGLRSRVAGLVALSAAMLLLWRPQQLFDAGFQLSYGVVLGLMLLTMPLRRRWFGLREENVPSSSAMMRETVKDVFAASIVAWLIAAPIVAHHFGLISMWAVFGSVLVLPLVAMLLALGYAKIILSAVIPSAALFVSGPLAAGADMMLAFVDGLDALPLATLRVIPPSVAWVIGAEVAVIAWMRHGVGRAPRRAAIIAAILILWLIWPALPLRPQPALRVDMISVGDGSCIVVRSGGATVVFDAGSSTDLDAGRRRIIPALERLGVTSIDAICVSHPDLDHFSAVLELADRFHVARVLLTPQFLLAAEHDPLSPTGYLFDELSRRLLIVEPVAAGDVRTFGGATWTWLHPGADATFRFGNDGSMVVHVDAGVARLLLTGDIQREAIATLLGEPQRLRADILELPHHGSYNNAAVALVEHVDPMIVLQSTGWSRLDNDLWLDALPARSRRHITALDGTISVLVDHQRRLDVRTFRPSAAGGEGRWIDDDRP